MLNDYEWPDRVFVSTARLIRSRVLPIGGDTGWLSAGRGWVRVKEDSTSWSATPWELQNIRAVRLVATQFPWVLATLGVPASAILAMWYPGPALLAFALVSAVAVGSWRDVWVEVIGDVFAGGSAWSAGGGSLCFQAQAMWGESRTTRTQRLADQLAATVLGAANAEPLSWPPDLNNNEDSSSA